MVPIIVALTWLIKLVFLAFVLMIGIWIYRRMPLRSLPWIGAYLLLSSPLSFMASLMIRQVVDETQSIVDVPFGLTLGGFLTVWSAGNGIVSNGLYILLAILIFSDLLFLLTQVGREPRWRPVQLLLQARRYSTALGSAMIALLLVPALTAASLWVT